MSTRTGTPVFVIVTAIVVVVALATTLSFAPGGTRTTTTVGPTSAYATSPDGLRLTLQISGSQIQQGGSVAINVTETNTNTKPLNQSAKTAWAIQGLRMNACYDSVYPFGVAVYKGHYTVDNLSFASRLNLYPFEPCPLLIRYISGYHFQPASDMALVLPGSGSSLPMAAGVIASGNFTSGDSRTNFMPGVYTVVAGDEWGSLVFLYFAIG